MRMGNGGEVLPVMEWLRDWIAKLHGMAVKLTRGLWWPRQGCRQWSAAARSSAERRAWRRRILGKRGQRGMSYGVECGEEMSLVLLCVRGEGG